ncbi:hypothetical protein F5884DRAFT_886701 [Xylogone sp. PMI_703]|nr:hypothetical protein F5884DRAFT_886701 [Xylogone sp. PMI_703]
MSNKMEPGVQGWHPGELALQQKLNYADGIRDHWTHIENGMREQHRIFHTSNLPFIPITTIDDYGRPWGSIVAGATGEIGFVKSPDINTLTVNARLWEGDPLVDTVRASIKSKDQQTGTSERFLTAGLGIEFPTRRRNKFAGRIRGVRPGTTDLDCELDLQVTQAVGNCPKYINIRKLVSCPDTHSSVAYQKLSMEDSERLPDELIKFITDADTVFIASVYKSEVSPYPVEKYPSHAGMNARGGLPGFMRVSPSDGRTVVLPDYSGNRFLSTLGNIEVTKLAGLTVVSFTTGDILYLTGIAQVLVGPQALDIMPRQACITTIKTTGYTFVCDALPVRQAPETEVGRSPYSPKIRYLMEEPEGLASISSDHKAKLISATQFAHDIAIFRFHVISRPGARSLNIRPGQAIILDFMDWIGPPVYKHMANDAPSSINDDRVRTWTVSSAHEGKEVLEFELTMREMKGGVVTGALFNALREYSSNQWGHPIQIKKNIIADIVGVTGDFHMGDGQLNMLWVAGGIGITPFMAMLTAITERGYYAEGAIILALSTREPDIFLKLIKTSLYNGQLRAKRDVSISEVENPNLQVLTHEGRIPPDYWSVAEGKDVFICGPSGFGDAAVNGLSKIYREGFY